MSGTDGNNIITQEHTVPYKTALSFNATCFDRKLTSGALLQNLKNQDEV